MEKNHNYFGDEAAEKDDMLDDCFIEFPPNISSKSILTGRWGVGKTAIVFNQNKEIRNALNNNNIWYLGESVFDKTSLLNIQRKYVNDKDYFKRALEKMWLAEITRTYCILLSKLWSYYGKPHGSHWNDIKRFSKYDKILLSFWQRAPEVIEMLPGINESQFKAVFTMKNMLSNMLCKKTFASINKCLTDISNNKGKTNPLISIEPIESPSSSLEDEKGLSNFIITSLLNVFQSIHNSPDNKHMDIRISIPWHRYIPDYVDFPQRIDSYVGEIIWSEENLFDFINERIEWEFKRLGHKELHKHGGWYNLFEETILNEFCGHIYENTFQYILRHTHYRPRDIQRIARMIVENQAISYNCSIEDVFHHAIKDDRKICHATIQNTIRQISKDTIKIYCAEVSRKFPDIKHIIKELNGLPVPFSISDLKQKCKFTPLAIRKYDHMELIEILWECGLLGVELRLKGGISNIDTLFRQFTDIGYRNYSVDGKGVHRWYFFEYNWNGKPNQLLDKFNETSKFANSKLVLHPKTFDDLLLSVDPSCPIGI